MRWVHLVTAESQIEAEMWVELLRNQGVAAVIRPSDNVSFLGVGSMGTRIQVAEDDLDNARDILGLFEEEVY